MNTKTLLLTLGGTVGAVALPLSVVSCTKVQNNDNKVENPELEKPQSPVDGVELPDSDKIPPKQRVKLYVPIKDSSLGTSTVEFDIKNALKMNSHLKGLDLDTYFLLIKGRLLENAINKQYKFNVADLNSFFWESKDIYGNPKGGSLHRDSFNASIAALADHETIITVYKDK